MEKRRVRRPQVGRWLGRVTAGAAALALGVTGLATVPTAEAATVDDWAKLPGATKTDGVVTVPFQVQATIAGGKKCTVDAQIHIPETMRNGDKLPAILGGHGFDGNKNTDVLAHRWLAKFGYVVVGYSQVGFGQSGCKIGLQAPDIDGASLRPILDFLGGKPGVAKWNGKALPVPNFVKKDAKDHNGRAEQYDPRVGMFGFSYGAGAQYALAAEDPRVDAIAPMMTATDYGESIFPNDTFKTIWGGGLFLVAAASNVARNPMNPFAAFECGAQDPAWCQMLNDGLLRGWPTKAQKAKLAANSPINYANRIKIPVLIGVGQQETLFQFNGAQAMYEKLKKQGNPDVRLFWSLSGHDEYLPWEYDIKRPSMKRSYMFDQIVRFLNNHLKDAHEKLGPNWQYYRVWKNGETLFARYGSLPDGRAPYTQTYYLDSQRRLNTVAPTKGVRPDLWSGNWGVPTNIRTLDQRNLLKMPIPDWNAEGTYRTWMSEAYRRPFRVVGSPTIDWDIDTNAEIGSPHRGDAVIFVRIYDVAPDGRQSLVNFTTTPIRVHDSTKRVKLKLNGLAYDFGIGHRMAITVTGTDINYTGQRDISRVVIDTAKKQRIDFPVVVS